SCTVDAHKSGGKNVIRILVPRGDDPPYAVEDSKIYIRAEAETGLAVRDEIVGLVTGKQRRQSEAPKQHRELPKEEADPSKKGKSKKSIENPPRTGVEVVSVSERNGVNYYTVKDLRNGNVVKNVTQKSARRLWHYAITDYDKLPKEKSKIEAEWQGSLGLMKRSKQGKIVRFDLLQSNGEEMRYYFGVTEDGIHGGWRNLVGAED
ncbi:MAG: hypothetical protein N2D54_10195, partial [Chloroflexota bacterium]